MGGLSNEPIPDSHAPQTGGLQFGDHRLSTLCGVIEQPDHHCGDDLIILCLRTCMIRFGKLFFKDDITSCDQLTSVVRVQSRATDQSLCRATAIQSFSNLLV